MSQQIEKGWMFEDRFSHLYRTGVDTFISFAYKNRTGESEYCPCPCRVCRNAKYKKFERVRHDLKVNGMLVTYLHWSLHGEKLTPPSKVVAANVEQLVQEETLVEPVEKHVAEDSRDDGNRPVFLSDLFVKVSFDQPAKDYYILASTRFTRVNLITTSVLRYTNSQTDASGPLPVAPPLLTHWSMKQARTFRWNLTAPDQHFEYHVHKVGS